MLDSLHIELVEELKKAAGIIYDIRNHEYTGAELPKDFSLRIKERDDLIDKAGKLNKPSKTHKSIEAMVATVKAYKEKHKCTFEEAFYIVNKALVKESVCCGCDFEHSDPCPYEDRCVNGSLYTEEKD